MNLEKIVKKAIREVLSEEKEYEWITSPGACDICEEMDGERRIEDGEYEGGLVPGEVHENCKCEEELVEEE